MGLLFRSPIVKTPNTVQKSGNIPVTISLQGMQYWDSLSASIIKSIGSNITKLNLTTVDGQTAAFMRCAPVSAIVSRLAEYSMNGRYAFVDDNGKELTKVNNPLYKIMERPNFFQTWAEFISSVMTYVKLHGQCYILPIVPAGFDPSQARSMIVIPNWAVTPNYTGKSVMQTDISGVVRDYRVSFLANPIPASQMLVIRDSSPAVVNDSKLLFEGQSRLYSLGDQINNLIAIQDALYNLTTRRGAMGALVPEPNKDGTGMMIPLDPKEKQDVIDSFLSYGIGTNHTAPFHVLASSMKWVQMAMNVGELKLFEGNEAGIAQISMSMNVPLFLLGFKDSTFTNLEAAGKACYTSGVIPAVNNICSNLSTFFKCEGFELKVFFDHLEIFQKNKKEEAEALNSMTTALDKPFKSRIIGVQEYRNMIANFMPVGVQFDPLAAPTDLYEGQPTQTIVTQ